jgi:hypothetical protein
VLSATQWLVAPDMSTQKALASDIQLQAFTDVPCLPLGLSTSRLHIVTT